MNLKQERVMKTFFVHFISSRSSCSTNSTTADEDDDFQVRARSVDCRTAPCPPAAGSQEASTARGARVSSSPNLEQNSDHEIDDDDDEMKLIVHI